MRDQLVLASRSLLDAEQPHRDPASRLELRGNPVDHEQHGGPVRGHLLDGSLLGLAVQAVIDAHDQRAQPAAHAEPLGGCVREAGLAHGVLVDGCRTVVDLRGVIRDDQLDARGHAFERQTVAELHGSHTYIYIYIYISKYIYIHICVCMYVCMHVCIDLQYTHIYI